MKAIDILVIEDNDDHADLILDSLLQFNSENRVFRLPGGEDIIAMLNDRDSGKEWEYPDIILLDLKMPRVDGIEVLRQLKSDPDWKKIPVVILTTSSIPKDINTCYELGANSFVSKPLSYTDFMNTVGRINRYWVDTSRLPE